MEQANDWYILKGDEKIGPFDYSSMIQMIQENELTEYNYVWAPHLEGWSSIGETPDFSKDRLARVYENKAEYRDIFKVRACPRAAVELALYAHDNKQFFDGKTLSVSANGALLLLNTPMLLPGQEILIHFRADAAFNAKAVIVRKNMTRSRLNVKSGLQYAVRFTEVALAGQDVIQKIVNDFTKKQMQTNSNKEVR